MAKQKAPIVVGAFEMQKTMPVIGSQGRAPKPPDHAGPKGMMVMRVRKKGIHIGRQYTNEGGICQGARPEVQTRVGTRLTIALTLTLSRRARG